MTTNGQLGHIRTALGGPREVAGPVSTTTIETASPALINQIPTKELEQEYDTVMDKIKSRAKGLMKISIKLDIEEDKRCTRWVQGEGKGQ